MNKIYSLCIVIFLLHLAGCSKNGSNPDDGTVNTVNPASSSVIYEANPKLFSTNGALDAIADRLDNISELGADILWLMPVYEQGVLNAIGSPYCIKDYRKVNPDYGTADDLKNLVARAHDMGLRVILDWVANHTSWDNAWISEHKDWYTQDAGGNIISPEGMGWPDVADLNYSSQELRSEMIASMKYWIEETGIDGFRCDYAEGVPLDFWKTAIAELRAVKPDIIMLAEGGDSDLYTAGFDLLYGWSFASELDRLFSGSATPASLYSVHTEEYSGIPEGKMRMRYSTNHDLASAESPLQCYGGKEGAMAAFAISVMLPGIPMVYSSQEIGYSEALSFFDYNIMDWDSEPEYQSEYRDLLKVYKNTASLRSGNLKTYDTGNDAVSFCYQTSDGGVLFVIVNITGDDLTVKTPMERAGDGMSDAFTGEPVTLPSVLDLAPYQYMILKK